MSLLGTKYFTGIEGRGGNRVYLETYDGDAKVLVLTQLTELKYILLRGAHTEHQAAAANTSQW